MQKGGLFCDVLLNCQAKNPYMYEYAYYFAFFSFNFVSVCSTSPCGCLGSVWNPYHLVTSMEVGEVFT